MSAWRISLIFFGFGAGAEGLSSGCGVPLWYHEAGLLESKSLVWIGQGRAVDVGDGWVLV